MATRIAIKDYPRYFACDNGEIWDSKKEKYLKQYQRGGNRLYKGVVINTGNGFKLESVHRLIAKAFLPNPFNLPEVNHKDENPSNNKVDNLEWCSREYNNNYGSRNARSGKTQRNRKDCSKSVSQYDKNMNLINTYPSAAEAARQTKIGHSKIVDVCNMCKYCHTAGGYIWKWS